MIDLSVVIPAYQESQRLPPTLERIRDYLETRALSWEVIVVDDGSTDGTAEAARKVGLQQLRLIEFPENRGKGAAIRAGVMQSRGESVLLTDADLATPIEELEKLEQHRSGAPIVFASRALASSRIDRRQPPHREWLGRIFNRILRLLGAADIRDTQCGFKLFDGEVARSLFDRARVDGFAFDVEILLLARKRGLEVAEVGVVWRHVEESRVHLVRDSFHMLWDVLRVRWSLRG